MPTNSTAPDADATEDREQERRTHAESGEGGRRPRAPGALASALVVLVPTVLGLALGWLSVALPGPGYSATTLVQAGPGTTATDPLDYSSDQVNRFVQTEVVYVEVSSGAIADALRAALNTPDPPSVTADQVGTTALMSIDASAADADAAATAANTAADVYVEGWRERTTQDIDAQVEVIDERLTQISGQLADLGDNPATPQDQAARDVLAAELQNLTSDRASLVLQRQQVQAASRVVDAATPGGAAAAQSAARNALLGGVVGLVVGLALLAGWRRLTRPRITTPWYA